MIAPPKRSGKPVLGSALDLAAQPIQFLLGLFRTYGDVSTFTVPGDTFALVAHPDDVRTVFKDPDDYPRCPMHCRYVTLRHSMMTLNGEDWRRSRRMFQGCFRPNDPLAYAAVIAELTDRMLAQWAGYAATARDFEASNDFMG